MGERKHAGGSRVVGGRVSLILAVGGLASGLAAGWAAHDILVHSPYVSARMKADNERAKAERDAANTALKERIALEQKLAAMDAAFSERLADAAAETERLRSGLRDGSIRLRVHPSLCSSVPERDAPSPAGVDNAPPSGPDPDVRSAYLSLRSELTQAHAQLNACQQYVRDVQDWATPRTSEE